METGTEIYMSYIFFLP